VSDESGSGSRSNSSADHLDLSTFALVLSSERLHLFGSDGRSVGFEIFGLRDVFRSIGDRCDSLKSLDKSCYKYGQWESKREDRGTDLRRRVVNDLFLRDLLSLCSLFSSRDL